jgi:CRISPR-associated protein Csx17
MEVTRSIATLGVDRGIAAFHRYAIVKGRVGRDNNTAASIGRFEVQERPEADLLRELDHWLDDFRQKCAQGRDKEEAPQRFLATLRSIDASISEFCRYGGAGLFQNIVISLGRAERALATTQGKFKKKKVLPIPPLSPPWVTAVADQSPEFLLARALTSIDDAEKKLGPWRSNLEPVDWHSGNSNWMAKDRAVVWNAADFPANLASVLTRRLMDGARAGCARPPLAAHFTAPLGAIARFIAGETDDARIEDLIWGLMLLRDDKSQPIEPHEAAPGAPIPTAYALLKLLFLPRPLVIEHGRDGLPRARLAHANESGIAIYAEPSLPALLRAGQLGQACIVAMRRLRASGLDPLPGPIRGLRVRDREWGELDRMGSAGLDPQRLAAALLIPISDTAVNRLLRLVIRIDDLVDEQADAAG